MTERDREEIKEAVIHVIESAFVVTILGFLAWFAFAPIVSNV